MRQAFGHALIIVFRREIMENKPEKMSFSKVKKAGKTYATPSEDVKFSESSPTQGDG